MRTYLTLYFQISEITKKEIEKNVQHNQKLNRLFGIRLDINKVQIFILALNHDFFIFFNNDTTGHVSMYLH